MITRILKHVVVTCLTLAACGSGSSITAVIADQQKRLRQFESHAGITSPVVDCVASNGCTPLPGSHPALYVQVISNRALIVGLDSSAVDDSRTNENVHIDSMASSTQLQVEKTGYSRVTVGFDASGKPLNELRIHLLLVAPLLHRHRYRLSLPSRHGPILEFTYLENFISPSIQVNQVGYLPGGNKLAYVGNWLGTAGPMPVVDTDFAVISITSGRIVLQGKLQKVTSEDAWSGNAVYRVDFSALEHPGEYVLRIPGLGKSESFSIAKDVFKPVFRRVFRLFYHSRNSTAIRAPWADPGYERPSGTPPELSALMHASVAASPLSDDKRPGSYKLIRRGWFDAGDYGQYVVNAAPVWHAFGVGMDLMPAVFSTDDFGIPEENNHIPDVIDELEWGMDWLLSMQATQGGVYSRVVPLQWDDTLPQHASRPRYVFEITSHATASFAAVTALHARLLASRNPQRAARLLEASRAAWDFLQRTRQWPAEGDVYRNPKSVHAGEYPDTSTTDNRLWAAAELYRATGEAEFKKAFIGLLDKFRPDPTEGVTFRHQGLAAYWSMYRALEENRQTKGMVFGKTERILWDKLTGILIAAADWYLRKADGHPWNAPLHQHMGYTGWGTFAHSSRAVLPLLQAWAITSDERYCRRAAEMTNPQLGANPQSISYITGIGDRSPRFPLSKLSNYDGNVRPLNGIPVNGPHYHLPAIWPSTRAVNETYLPSGAEVGESADPQHRYPPLRRYVDSFLLPPMSEPTIAEYAATTVAYGLLTGVEELCLSK